MFLFINIDRYFQLGHLLVLGVGVVKTGCVVQASFEFSDPLASAQVFTKNLDGFLSVLKHFTISSTSKRSDYVFENQQREWT